MESSSEEDLPDGESELESNSGSTDKTPTEETPLENDDEFEQFKPVNEPVSEPETANTENKLTDKQNPHKERAKRVRKLPKLFTARFASCNDQIPQSLNEL